MHNAYLCAATSDSLRFLAHEANSGDYAVPQIASVYERIKADPEIQLCHKFSL